MTSIIVHDRGGWFWLQGYEDAVAGRRWIVPDATRQQWQRSDYAAGYEAGLEDVAGEAMDDDDDDRGPH